MTPTARSSALTHSLDFLPGHWVRLRSFVVLRWVAILGQCATIFVSSFWLALDIPLWLAFFAISISVFVNIISFTLFPKNARLDDPQATAMLLFDMVQLAFMVYLTGGLHNPFMVLVIAPVTLAATALSDRAIFIVGSAAILVTSFVAIFHLPLHSITGEPVLMPDLFVFGLWAAVVISVVFIGLYTRRISSEVRSVSQALLATQMALSREQNLTDLGGVVAAAAHELGTPLATIKLVASEMADELAGQEDLQDDAKLIGAQTDRCKDILRSMGQAGKDDMMVKTLPLPAVVEEAAKPHMNRGKTIDINILNDISQISNIPVIERRAEIIHGVRNLIQNAVDFAKEAVEIEISWNDYEIKLRIIDDGDGFSPQVLNWIGDPFIRPSKPDGDMERRREYNGMGLGLFIAKTLLNRTGAQLSFFNNIASPNSPSQPSRSNGAIAQILWKRKEWEIEKQHQNGGLGENHPF